MPWTILKFGGTSVGSPQALRSTLGIIRRTASEGLTAVVVSALAGVTDALLELLDQALAGEEIQASLNALRARHQGLLHEVAPELPPGAPAPLPLPSADSCLGSGPDPDLDLPDHTVERLLLELRGCRWCPDSARAAVLSQGERWSARLVAAALQAAGAGARPRLPGDTPLAAEGPFLEAEPDLEATGRRWQALAARHGQGDGLVVLPGFFGTGADGLPRLLGRGGSDTAATALGAALQAQRVEIWTDVSGVYPTDPRHFPTARPFPYLDYLQAEILAQAGARVLHARCLEPARRAGIPVVVRNTFQPEAPGTWIGSQWSAPGDSPMPPLPAPVPEMGGLSCAP